VTEPREPLSPGSPALSRRLFALSWKHRGRSLRVLFLQLALLALGVGSLGLVGLGIDSIRFAVEPEAGPPRWPFGISPPPGAPPLGVVLAVAAGILAAALARAFVGYLHAREVAVLVEEHIVVDLRARVYDKLQRLSFQFFDANASGSIINRVTGDSRAVASFVNNVLIQGTAMLLTIALYLAYMLAIHVELTLLTLATTPLLWVTAVRFSGAVQPAYVRQRELADRMMLTLAETVQGIHVVKGFDRGRERLAAYESASEAMHREQRGIFRRLSAFTPFVGFLAQVNICVLLAYGGRLVMAGELPIGSGMVVFAGLLQQLSGQISNLAQITNSVQQSIAAAKRVFEVLDAPVAISSPPAALRLPRPAGEIRFEKVSFAHGAAKVLDDVSLEIRAGERLAILGPTGCGKTTLLSLIPRFYDPASGRVLLDGVDVRHLHLDDLRRQIGVVFQESFLFSNTVAGNIAFGHPDASREDVERAARIAAAHDFITKLPDGYDTLLGEGGKDLSGGQRQRLALARAVLLDPAVLLLDDPTASVDPDTEAEILEALSSAMRGRTTLIVAHRVSVLRRADRVLVMERGRVVQTGRHEELVRAPGLYRRAFELQEAV
jgi:ATP-binding cassette subfamily B protein